MKVAIIYYTMYGHTLALARAVEEGAKAVPGVEVVLRRVAEFESVMPQVNASEHARKTYAEQQAIPLAMLDDLRSADAVIFGSPTRYGNMAAQLKAFLDTTVQLWSKGELEGKPGAVFASTATTHGGQESTLLSMMNPLIHLGMVVVGVPYSTPGMIHNEARGSSPYGASVVAGPKGELAPHPADLEIGRALGKRVAEIAKKLRG
ncbi:MAG TPA: NAD(P)H:quinone oxidoreductase [Tepidisphaeraceae bacterium]|nr:NAD(P)H:quinone oxidoreductase [Tepidisphaeraceae bacterium]